MPDDKPEKKTRKPRTAWLIPAAVRPIRVGEADALIKWAEEHPKADPHDDGFQVVYPRGEAFTFAIHECLVLVRLQRVSPDDTPPTEDA